MTRTRSPLPIEYFRPGDPRQAVERIAQPASHALAGGTDLLVSLREGLIRAECVVDVRSLPGADRIESRRDGSVVIGAGARLASIAGDPAVRERLPALTMACASVGSPALRNMGTLGGNLCQRPRCWYFRSGIACLKSGGDSCPAVDGENQHLAVLGGGPCYAVHPSDPAVALTALDAVIHTFGPNGARSVPIAEFFMPPAVDPRRETVLVPGEIIVAIEVPAESSGGRQRFTKLLQRGAWDFALASIAVVRRRDGAVRMVLGGVAPAPWPVNPSVAEDVAAGGLTPDDLDALAQRALLDARPLSRNGYRVTLAHALLRDAMTFASSQ